MYKRQRSTCPRTITCRACGTSPCRTAASWMPRRQSILSVSYTHLDVYKRQELGGKVFKFGHLEKTREALATAYGLTPTDVQRFLGLHTLSSVLFECVDRRTLAISAATYLAQLPKEWQLEAARWISDKKISAYQAQQILFLYQNGGNEKGIKDIVQNTQNDSRHKITGSYKISRRMLKSYSPYLATMNLSLIHISPAAARGRRPARKRGRRRAGLRSPVRHRADKADTPSRAVVHRAGRARRAAADIADTGADP